MINLLRWLFPDRRTDEQKARDGVRKGVREHEKQMAKVSKRLKVKSTIQDSRNSLKVVR